MQVVSLNDGEGFAAGDVFATALPFLIGWFATAPLTGTFGEDARVRDCFFSFLLSFLIVCAKPLPNISSQIKTQRHAASSTFLLSPNVPRPRRVMICDFATCEASSGRIKKKEKNIRYLDRVVGALKTMTVTLHAGYQSWAGGGGGGERMGSGGSSWVGTALGGQRPATPATVRHSLHGEGRSSRVVTGGVWGEETYDG